jgi:hypothetical protein
VLRLGERVVKAVSIDRDSAAITARFDREEEVSATVATVLPRTSDALGCVLGRAPGPSIECHT